jgi:hypothetical protein
MRMMRLALAVLAATLAPAAGHAQGQGTPSCKDQEPPFALTAANRQTDAALQQAVVGKKFVYLRESLRTPGVWVKNMREHRGDGSFVYSCAYGRGADGPMRPCASFGSQEKRVAGARDVGVWNMKNDTVCSVKSGFGANTEDCFALHSQGGVFAARRVSGPRAACVNGKITFE